MKLAVTPTCNAYHTRIDLVDRVLELDARRQPRLVEILQPENPCGLAHVAGLYDECVFAEVVFAFTR
jgi:hypothetical protein